MEQDILYPYRTTPKRIADDVVAALASCPAVGRVFLFGSLAEDRHDAWSDIDAMCEVLDDGGAWAAASALREMLPVRWHGPFGGMAPPHGRHWFEGESLFHSLDISFYPAERLDEVEREGLNDVPVRLVEVARGPLRPFATPVSPLRPAGTDHEFTVRLYLTLKRMKDYIRGADAWAAVREAMAAFEAAARGMPRRTAGGEAAGIAQEARTLYQTLLMERSRYGGEP